MKENRRFIKSHSAIKYKAYTALLEGRINKREHDLLVELGFLDKIKSFFGGGMEIGGDLAKLFKNKVDQKQLNLAKENITKAITDLKQIAKKAGANDSVVNEFLKGVLDEAGVAPADIASAKPSKGEGGDDGGGAGGGDEVAPGEPVKASDPAAVPLIAAAAAQAAGQDPEAAKEQAAEKNVDVPKATQVLSKAIAVSSKVKVEKVTKIIDFLIQNKHMLAESRYSKSANLISAAKEASLRSSQSLIVERWISLAGIKLIKEEETPKVEEKTKKKFSDVVDDIRTKFKPDELTDDEILGVLLALDDLDSISIN